MASIFDVPIKQLAPLVLLASFMKVSLSNQRFFAQKANSVQRGLDYWTRLEFDWSIF